MKVEIDSHSGFCGGVIRAISAAETRLGDFGGRLYSLGAIVHNEEELSRLESMGLSTVSASELRDLEHKPGEPLLIRAHGEPPEVYRMAGELGYRIIDCTCPVVLKLQKDIREAYARLSEGGGRIVIFGKEGHPEVLGLVGQVGGDVVVVQNPDQAVDMVESGRLRTDRDIEVFSQTTMDPEGYARLCSYLRSRMQGAELRVHSTICSQVASRHKELAEFARKHDIVVFVSGAQSSNGKVLFELCRRENPRTIHLSSDADIRPGCFPEGASVGVCGATSTPKWLLEKVAAAIENLQ